MEFKFGQWNVFFTRHLCTCEVKTCRKLDREPECIRGCFYGNYFILDRKVDYEKAKS